MARNSEAVRLAEASDWKGLQRLIEIAPGLASERGDYGMLPIHWACTEPQVPLSLLDRLLAAYPDGARTKNAVHLLPLHIAIRARVQAHWLRRLLAANPLAVHVPTPEGLTVLELADQVGLSGEAMKVLIDAYGDVATPEQDDSSDGEDERAARNARKAGRGAPELHYELLHPHNDETRSPSAIDRSTRRGSQRYQLLQSHSEGDDERAWPSQLQGISRLTSTDTSDAVGSLLLRSFSSLSDDGALISPSSTSTSSQARSPSSANSAPLPLTASMIAPPMHKQMPGPFERKHSLDYQRHAATAAAAAHHHERVAQSVRSCNQQHSRSAGPMSQAFAPPAPLGGRHQSLPVLPSFDATPFAVPGARRYRDGSRKSSGEDDNDGSSSRSDIVWVGGRRFRRFDSTGNGSSGGLCAIASGHELDNDNDHDAYELEPGGGSSQLFESPPAWKRDDECAICRAAFGMFKHRHHCRNCGQSICSQHSADRKLPIAAKGFQTPQRVCVTCYAQLAHEQQRRGTSDFDTVLDAAGLSSGGPNPVAAFAMQQLYQHQHQHQQQQQQQYTPGNSGSPSEAFGSSTGPSASTALRNDAVLQSHVSALRHAVAAQQRQIEALVQTNMQLQHQVLEQEEAKAATTLLITQLMTRVSVLELQQNATQCGTDSEQHDVDDAADGDDGHDGSSSSNRSVRGSASDGH